MNKILKKNYFDLMHYQEARIEKFKSEVEKYRVRNGFDDMTYTIRDICLKTTYSEDQIKDALYRRKKSLSEEFLAKMEEILGLDNGELLIIKEGLSSQHVIPVIKRDILIAINELKIMDVFYLVNYMDQFLEMSYGTFYLLIQLNELNGYNRMDFYKRLITLSPTLKMDTLMMNVSRITPLILLSQKNENIIKIDFDEYVSSLKLSNDKNIEESIKNDLWSLLDSKLNNLFYGDLIKFYNMAQGIYTMDNIDWNIAIGFELLNVSFFKNENVYQNELINYLNLFQ